jgi:hypothetical protein
MRRARKTLERDHLAGRVAEFAGHREGATGILGRLRNPAEVQQAPSPPVQSLDQYP